MISLSKIEEFLSEKNIAIVGVSRSKNKTGSAIYTELKKQEYNVFAVNPTGKIFDEQDCYATVADLPDEVETVVIATNPKQTLEIVKSCSQKNVKNIWINLGSDTQEAIEFCEKNQIDIIYKKCIFMFAQPRSIHKFHAWLSKVFGAYPK